MSNYREFVPAISRARALDLRKPLEPALNGHGMKTNVGGSARRGLDADGGEGT